MNSTRMNESKPLTLSILAFSFTVFSPSGKYLRAELPQLYSCKRRDAKHAVLVFDIKPAEEHMYTQETSLFIRIGRLHARVYRFLSFSLVRRYIYLYNSARFSPAGIISHSAASRCASARFAYIFGISRITSLRSVDRK